MTGPETAAALAVVVGQAAETPELDLRARAVAVKAAAPLDREAVLELGLVAQVQEAGQKSAAVPASAVALQLDLEQVATMLAVERDWGAQAPVAV